jgi:hypothetical protein
VLLSANDVDAPIVKAAGRSWKGLATFAAYVLAIPLVFVSPLIAIAIYVAVAVLWLIPDKRLEALIE